MSDKYSKDDILSIPVLEPERHYETDGHIPYPESESTETPQSNDKLLEVLEEVELTYELVTILPNNIKTVLQNILQVLSVDTQSQIIERAENLYTNPEISIIEDEDIDIPEISIQPDVSISEVVDDIFSEDPIINVEPENLKNMLTLAQEAYVKDTNDLKIYYTGKIQQMTHRYFQLMSALAADCGVSDFTYLNKVFDSEAVTGIETNSMHLKDHITKSQVVRNQKERSLNKTHTTDRTLILTRAWLSAEKQRERYLSENYKTADTLSSTMSNDLLLRSRTDANSKYTSAMYNNYKYLNSSVILSSDILDMQISEAQAKSQLVKEGVNIFYSKTEEQLAAYESEVIAAAESKKTLSGSDDQDILTNISTNNKSTTVNSSNSTTSTNDTTTTNSSTASTTTNESTADTTNKST